MSILFITPDFASHYHPLIPIGHIWRDNGETVYVATGNHLKRKIENDGFVHVPLKLDDGGNDGLVKPETMNRDVLESLLARSRQGMISTLNAQATERQKHLLWSPVSVIRQIARIARQVRPRLTVSVQLAYNATLALKVLEIPFATFVTGHPMEYPMRCEIQGYQYYFPEYIEASDAQLQELARACLKAQESFTRDYNDVLLSHNSTAQTEVNAFSAGSSQLVVFNYPKQVLLRDRCYPPARTLFIGSSIREEDADDDLKDWLEHKNEAWPTILVTLGSLFSVRSDILSNVAGVLRREEVRVLLSLGGAPLEAVQPVPDHWLIRRWFPQVAILPYCDLIVFHGGNNSFTEALTHGVSMLVGPLSSDQFYCAADVERVGLGCAFDPNSIWPDSFLEKTSEAIECRSRCREIGKGLRECSGAQETVEHCEQVFAD